MKYPLHNKAMQQILLYQYILVALVTYRRAKLHWIYTDHKLG